ncbi:MAG: hypothetical protein FD144_4633 [Rhodospirillaceae bacterium]|nr:MAG: hypothetical protein FD144_4633 [Rhodospirillaceae bacterium]
MARKPNYDFERRERERLKAIKVAEKAEAKRAARERAKLGEGGDAAAGEGDPTADKG